MAKTVKKAGKPAAKTALKAPAKPMKKQAKPVPVLKKAAAKPAPTKVVKPAPKKDEKAPDKNAKAVKKPVEKPVAAAPKVKPVKVDAKAKKAKRDAEPEDDLMVSDEDLGAEEIPDLSEFDEEEEAPVEVEAEEEEEDDEPPPPDPDADAILTDAEGRPYCKVKECDQIAAVEGYCRFHYLLLWKKIQVRRKILIDGKLERYVEELTARYPDKFLEMIKRDVRTEKDFLSAIAELEIDESGLDNEFEDESQALEEVRGFGSESAISDDEEF